MCVRSLILHLHNSSHVNRLSIFWKTAQKLKNTINTFIFDITLLSIGTKYLLLSMFSLSEQTHVTNNVFINSNYVNKSIV